MKYKFYQMFYDEFIHVDVYNRWIGACNSGDSFYIYKVSDIEGSSVNIGSRAHILLEITI